MIEVIPAAGGWTWQFISADGRILFYSPEVFSDDGVAFDTAKAYRTAFWARACQIDHRMGACI